MDLGLAYEGIRSVGKAGTRYQWSIGGEKIVRTRPVKYLFIIVLRDEVNGRRGWGKHASHWATIQPSSTSVPA